MQVDDTVRKSSWLEVRDRVGSASSSFLAVLLHPFFGRDAKGRQVELKYELELPDEEGFLFSISCILFGDASVLVASVSVTNILCALPIARDRIILFGWREEDKRACAFSEENSPELFILNAPGNYRFVSGL